ncbi:MAG: SPOR domain-containing protein [bacterium]|nr:SPOR domain-containing protein [bacterium]
MSASSDQSYYEIALTNRQVMSIFVVLLICILAAFLGGVWLGRDADAAVEMASTESILATESGEAPFEELDFFTRRDDAAGVSEGPSPPAIAAEEGAAGTESPAGSGDEVSAVERRIEKQPDRAQAPAEPAAASPESASRGSEAAASVPDSVVIQVFSSNEEAQARRVVDQLRKSGYPAVLSPVEVAGRTLHRVRIGPYTDPDEAQVVAESVRRAFKLDTWITH